MPALSFLLQFGQVLKNLKPGELWPNIIEEDSSYGIVQLISVDKGSYKYGYVVVPKGDFDKWFKIYVEENIKIHFIDQSLLKAIKNQYPDLWWLRVVFVDEDN